MSSLIEISDRFLTSLTGLTVLQSGTTVPVRVIAGVPQEDFLEKNFPAIAVNLTSATPDEERRDSLPDVFGRSGSTAWEKLLPEPWNFTYQVEIFARYTQHQDIITEFLMRKFSRDSREGFLVGTAELAADVLEGMESVLLVDSSNYGFGDLFILDASTTYSKSGKQQAFFVVGTASDGGLAIEPAANQDFLAGSATCYKARYEVVFDAPLQFDVGQDGGRSYQRRILFYTIWGALDLDTAREIRVVTADGLTLNWVPTTPEILGKRSWTAC